MNKFKLWDLNNRTEITWFLMGWLVLAGIQDLSQANYIGALISFGLVYINYKLK
jgi:hypothetical protein